METELTTEEIRVLTEYIRRSLMDYLKEDRYEAISSFDDVGKIYLAYFKLKKQMSEKLSLEFEMAFGVREGEDKSHPFAESVMMGMGEVEE